MPNVLRQQFLGPFTNIMFEIRRVKISDYMRELKDLPFHIAPGTQAELQKLETEVAKLPPEKYREVNDRATRLFIENGLVRMKYPGAEWIKPNIWFGDGAACPDDLVTMADLGTDADLLVREIATLTFDLKGVKALEGFFRGQLAANSGPSGEEVRPEAVEPSAA